MKNQLPSGRRSCHALGADGTALLRARRGPRGRVLAEPCAGASAQSHAAAEEVKANSATAGAEKT